MGNSASTSHSQERAAPAQQQPVHPPPPPFSAYPPPTVFGANGQRQAAPYYNYTPPGPYGSYPPPPPAGYSGYSQAPPPPNYGPPGGGAPPGAAGPSPYQAPQGPKPQEYQRTATVRNQVNLKKATLKLEKVNGSDEVLAITFKFDATAACRVTTFVRATESRKGCKITTPHPPAPAVHFPKGLDQAFQPSAGSSSSNNSGAAAQHCVDLRLHPVSDLLALTGADTAADAPQQQQQQQAPQGAGHTYALVIRMEALTEEGRQGNRQLEALEPGCELPEWVQAQSTYVRLVRDDDGQLSVRVLKQTIWVKGESYELQEIYGMERSTARPAAPSAVGTVAMGMPTMADGLEDPDGNECVICMSAPRDTAALPCRHMCMCHTCAGELKSQTNKCPICRNEIEKLLHIKILHKGANGAGAPGAAAGGASSSMAAGPSGAAVAKA